jgi:hypothetical protein
MKDGNDRITQERVLAMASQVVALVEDYRYAQGTESSLYERMAALGMHDSDDIRRGVHRQMLVDGAYPSPLDVCDTLQALLKMLGDLCPEVKSMVRDLHLDLYTEIWPAEEDRERAPARRVRKDVFFRRLGNAAGKVIIIQQKTPANAAQPVESLFADRESCAQKFITTYGPDSGRYGGVQVVRLAVPGEMYQVTYDYGGVATFDVIILEGAGQGEGGGAR